MLIPDNETAVDFLNCEAISNTVIELLNSNRMRALTIGVHGDWGAGKSSILKMVQVGLSKDSKVACLWFNGWAFQGFEDAKTVLIEATITELMRQRFGISKVKDLGKKLLKRVDWLKVAKKGGGLAFNVVTGLPSPDQIGSVLSTIQSTISGLGQTSPEDLKAGLEQAAGFLKKDEGEEERNIPEAIHHFREEFSALLEAAGVEQLVVMIDDLDRCLPSIAIETLEAIRLFLFVPKTAFIIGADEGMIEYAVRQHFPDLPVSSGPLPYARNYLEKLIQVPFRIPALGTQETRTYVTLLLVESIVGGDHVGFKELLTKAKAALNKPWLGTGLLQGDIQRVDSTKRAQLDAAFMLAAQTGPILAEGTKGNPRQIKRFLNALLVRQAIAKARGFEDAINQSKLAKLMLAERFQPDFYEHIASQAMTAHDGKSIDLQAMEADQQEAALAKTNGKNAEREDDSASPDVSKWLEREWLRRWVKMDPALGSDDLRPYAFVSRDKRLLASGGEVGGIDALVTKLSSSGMALRVLEPEVKALPPTDAEVAFNALRERALGAGNFTSPPPGFEGMMVIAKHHTRFQSELLSFIQSVDAQSLGVWVVKGWNEILTDTTAKGQLQTILTGWAQQDKNGVLKKVAGQALAPTRKMGGR
jgi:predicted KAP-like P-loop ATPase